MEKFTILFSEFLVKAIVMTEEAVQQDNNSKYNYELFAENRERLVGVLDQIGGHIEWSAVSDETKADFAKQIDYLKNLDEKLVARLQEYKIEVQKEIESTHRNHTAVKGYNLNDVK